MRIIGPHVCLLTTFARRLLTSPEVDAASARRWLAAAGDLVPPASSAPCRVRHCDLSY